MTPAARLRRLMNRRQVPQVEIALRIGATPQWVNNVLSGHPANPGILTVEKIVEALGATMAELYEDD